MGKADPGDSHPIINEWGMHGRFLARWGWSGPSLGNLHMSPELSLLLACLKLITGESPWHWYSVLLKLCCLVWAGDPGLCSWSHFLGSHLLLSVPLYIQTLPGWAMWNCKQGSHVWKAWNYWPQHKTHMLKRSKQTKKRMYYSNTWDN
jgi:hypothetical protein